MRRIEFACTDIETARNILTGTRYGHLATCGPDGEPEVRPMNYVLVDDTVYFHCAEGGSLAARAGTPAVLSAVDATAWLPSYWRHPATACVATTWYRSVQVRGRLREVDSLEEKAAVMNAFMARYQPEGGYARIDAHGKYAGSLRALTVFALPLMDFVSKVKAGQHLTPSVRAQIQSRLMERGWRKDWRILREMERANPELHPSYPCVDSHGMRWIDDPAQVPLYALTDMLSGTYWAATRPMAQIAENLRESTLTLAAFQSGRLVAHARVNAIGPQIAWLFDVVVDEPLRGRGVGASLISRVLTHRSVCQTPRVFLDTRDAMGFYGRFGFVELMRDGSRDSTLMMRVRERSDAEPPARVPLASTATQLTRQPLNMEERPPSTGIVSR